ncbi:hypothetical protein QP028_06580 [Corynebacterium suedekumii]|nr:hypothetical protein QP028_06580 [Corynebacterium suedekumii]
MTDYYSLDDTLAGRVTQSGVVGAFVASPDYVSSRPARALVKLGLLAGGGALVAVLNSFDEDPDNDPAVMVDQLRQSIGHIGHRAGPDSDTPAGDFSVDSPTRTWAIIVAAAVVILMTVRVDAAVQRRIAALPAEARCATAEHPARCGRGRRVLRRRRGLPPPAPGSRPGGDGVTVLAVVDKQDDTVVVWHVQTSADGPSASGILSGAWILGDGEVDPARLDDLLTDATVLPTDGDGLTLEQIRQAIDNSLAEITAAATAARRGQRLAHPAAFHGPRAARSGRAGRGLPRRAGRTHRLDLGHGRRRPRRGVAHHRGAATLPEVPAGAVRGGDPALPLP